MLFLRGTFIPEFGPGCVGFSVSSVDESSMMAGIFLSDIAQYLRRYLGLVEGVCVCTFKF